MVTDSSALYRTLHCHALHSTPAVDLVVSRFINMHENFTSLLSLHPFQCGKENEIPSTLGNTGPSENYPSDTQAMILQSVVPCPRRELSLPAKVKKEITMALSALREVAFETTNTPVCVTKVNIAHYRHGDVLFSVIQIDDPVVTLRDVSGGHVLPFILFFCVHGFDRVTGTLSISTTAAAIRF